MRLEIAGREAYAGTLGRAVEGERPTVVFVHGAALDHTVWTPFARYFVRHGYNTLALDLPGHGRSHGPPLDRIEAIADWVDAALDAAGVARALLVGHSLGSLVALEIAGRGTRASGLGLVGIGLPMAVSDALLDAARADRHEGLDMVNLWGHGPRAHLGGISTPGVWMLGTQLKLLERAAPGVLFADLTACNEYGRGLERAAQVACPTALVLGERDAMTPVRAAQALEAALADVGTTVIEGTGHAMMAERPNEVLDALAALAGRVRARSEEPERAV